MNTYYRALFALLFIAAIPGTSARAVTFQATLSSIRADLEPGGTVIRHFMLTLGNDQPRTQFKVHVQDWWRSEDGRQSFYRDPGTLPHSCAPWVQINPAEQAVDPGGMLDARLSVSVPQDAKPGGYWCVLTIDEVPDPLKTTPEGVGMQFYASVSVGVFINVGTVNKEAHILQVQVEHDTAEMKVANTGDCPLSVGGRIEFMKDSLATAPLFTLTIPKTTVVTDPVNTAILTARLPATTDLPSGTYLVRAIIDIGLDHYIGAQKVLEITRETPPTTIQATQHS